MTGRKQTRTFRPDPTNGSWREIAVLWTVAVVGLVIVAVIAWLT